MTACQAPSGRLTLSNVRKYGLDTVQGDGFYQMKFHERSKIKVQSVVMSPYSMNAEHTIITAVTGLPPLNSA
jgi:hypothetical protein